MTLSRREFVQLAAAMGASLAWSGPGPRVARPTGAKRAISIPKASRRAIPTPTASSCGPAARSTSGERPCPDRRGRGGRGLPPRRRAGAGARVSPRPTGRRACWSAGSSRRTSIGTASPMPTGTAAASAARSPRPPPNDPRPVNFAFVSCQDVNEGKLNGYRRMIFEDERARRRGPARFRPAPRRFHLRGRANIPRR